LYDREAQTLPLSEWLAKDVPWPLGMHAVGGTLRLRGASGNAYDEDRDARWFTIKEQDPIDAIEGLSYLEGVEHLISGLYRVTFHNTFALVDAERCRVAMTRADHTCNEYAALCAALGYRALYDTAEGTALSKRLAAAYYRLGEIDPTPTADEVAGVAYAANDLLRAQGGDIELNPEDLMRMAAPADAPPPQAVTRFENGESTYEDMWAAYAEAMEQFCKGAKSDSPELDLEALARFEVAISAHEIAKVVSEAEMRRQLLYREVLGSATPPLSAEQLELLADGMADSLRSRMRGGFEDSWEMELGSEDFLGQNALLTYNSYIATELAESFLAALPSSPELLEKVLPLVTRTRIEASAPASAGSAVETLTKGMFPAFIFSSYLEATEGSDLAIDWEVLQDIAAAGVAAFISMG
jgi:hypothetical protein